jgi:hypothetical protein
MLQLCLLAAHNTHLSIRFIVTAGTMVIILLAIMYYFAVQ